jgi:hypothetical protein
MATTAAPYGLRPVKRADGMPYAGATSTYKVNPAGLASNLFYGQVVNINNDGYITLSTATGADATTNALPVGTTLRGSLGVFVGCAYFNAQGQWINSQYYPSGTTGDVEVYVVDDPDVLFQAQLDGTATQAAIGKNTFFAAAQSTTTGNTRTGNSTSALENTVVSTTAAFRVVSFVSPVSDAFPDVLVKFNPGYHSMTNAVGAA